MNRLAYAALCVGALLSIGCSDKPSDQPVTSVVCEHGRQARLVVEPGATGGMSQASAIAGGGYALFASTTFAQTITLVDHDGTKHRTVAIPSVLGPVVYDVMPLPDGGAVLAGTADALSYGTPWVGRADANWQLVWEQTLKSGTTSRTQLAGLPDGGVVVAGTRTETSGPVTITWDRLSGTGEVLWERSSSLPDLQDSYGWSGRMLSVSPDGLIRLFVVTSQGIVSIQSTLEGETTSKLLDTTLALHLADTVGLPDGRTALASTRNSGAVLTMVAADGSVEWEQIYGKGERSWTDAIAYNGGRNEILLGGSYRGTDSGGTRTWIVAVDLDGNQTWQLVREPLDTNLGGVAPGASATRGPAITDIAPQPDGSFLATGQTTNLSYFVVGAESCAGAQP